MRYQVVPHDPAWKPKFEAEASQIASALSDVVVALHHIGSTAIPGISAKPIIDMLMVVSDLKALDDRCSAMERLGYESLGELGIPGRRYFRKNDEAGDRTHQVHGFRVGSPHIVRHLAFRDYMIAHPEHAMAYSVLKERLAMQHPDDMEAYIDGKDAFVKAHEAKALVWCLAEHTHAPAAL